VTVTLETPAAAVSDDGDAAPPEPRAIPAALAPWQDPHPLVGWLSTLVIAIFAGFTRFWALGFPPGQNSIPKQNMIFDEVYYAPEAQEMLRYGYEDNRGYMFIVHPPLGKWIIAFGEWLKDSPSTSHEYLTNSLGWRIMPALFGCLSVIVLSRTVRRMMRSNLFGFIAGALMCMEGLSLVLARTAILDIFLQFFVVAAFGALVVDRDKMRARLARLIADSADLGDGVPTLGPRPWRLLGGVLLGLASAVKWTGAYFFIAFILMSLVWDRAALKSAGVRRPSRNWARRAVLPGLGSFLLVPMGAYLLTYLGWFVGENGWNRHWADSHATSARLRLPFGFKVPFNWGWVPSPIRSLGDWTYHAYEFHTHLTSPHTYQSNPWSWLVLGRPVDFYYNGSSFPSASASPCGSTSCSREILLIGTPIMWWAFIPMLLWLAWHWLTTRDWRAAAVWIAFLAGWLVWFTNLGRTMFLFYMAPLVPFLIIGLTLALGTMLGPALGPRPERDLAAEAADPEEWEAAEDRAEAYERTLRRRHWGLAGVCVFFGLVVVDFAWMWPIFTGGLLSYDEWHAHMWLPSWV
jgi:dolichyl-phosphate-mannose--protein O-mannosyl transferase